MVVPRPVAALSRVAALSAEAVIFDLDGVIVDSEIWWHEVRVDWAASLGRTWTHADSAAVMGANSAGWARIMRTRMGLALDAEAGILDAVVDGMIARYAERGAPPIPGAVAAVRAVAERLPVAVASSAHAAIIAAALRATGLVDVAQVVVSSDEVAAGKPAPDVYLETARRLGITAARCLVVEDSINGVRAGRAAGMTVALVPNASVPPAAGAAELADLVVPDLASLVALLVGAASVDGGCDGADGPASPSTR